MRAQKKMLEHRIRHLPVMQDPDLESIFSTTGASRQFAEHLQPGFTRDERPLRA